MLWEAETCSSAKTGLCTVVTNTSSVYFLIVRKIGDCVFVYIEPSFRHALTSNGCQILATFRSDCHFEE